MGPAGTVAVAAGFALWQFLFNSETVIVLRDPGAYLQTGYWIAQHGSLPIPQSLAAFGGPHPGLGFSSIGFFSGGTAVVPGFMSGLPLLLAGGFWMNGTTAAAALGPILGGLAMLAFGGLVGRLTGPAVGARRCAGARAHAARAVHEPGLVHRDGRAGAAVRRAVPGGRRADSRRCGARSPGG